MSRRANRQASRRLLQRARKRLRKAGVVARAEAVHAAVSSPLFELAARAAIARAERRGRRIVSLEEVRAACMEALAQTFPDVDPSGVQLNFTWDPGTKKLVTRVREAAAAVGAAVAAAGAGA
jgi:hypothetical protein